MSTDLIASTLFPVTLAIQGAVGGGLLYTVLIGLVIGIVAKVITPGNEPVGCIITSIIGILGSVIALYVGRAIGHYEVGETPGFIASVVGAVILLVIYHLIIGNNRPGAPKL